MSCRTYQGRLLRLLPIKASLGRQESEDGGWTVDKFFVTQT
jgi:hypothetical protein